MCEHLTPLEQELKNAGIKETYRGQPWTDNCREWAYFDCVLDLDALKGRMNFSPVIEIHINNDQRSGTEAGFYCSSCKDAIMGFHPEFGAQGKRKFS